MDAACMSTLFETLAAAVGRHIPEFLEDPADRAIADGNVALLVVDGEGRVWGRFFGADKVKMRASGMVAWQKAMQVWLTGVATHAYEKQVYSGEKQWWKYGIPLPELIGWEGGLPAALDDGTPLALTFSGFRGDKDCEILARAVAETPGIRLVR